MRIVSRLICVFAMIGFSAATPARAEEITPLKGRMDKNEFNEKYGSYLLEAHVEYVSTEFAESLIPTTRNVFRTNRKVDPRSIEMRIRVADELYKNFSPSEFDEIADFPEYQGPGENSLNKWVKSLQKSVVQGGSLRIEKPLAWWSVYLGVAEALDNEAVMKWARRQHRRARASLGEIVVKVVLKNAIRQRYKDSAADLFNIVTDEYSTWHDSPNEFDPGSAQQRVHRIVLNRLKKDGRDAALFGE